MGSWVVFVLICCVLFSWDFFFFFLFLGVFVGVPGDFNGGLQRD